MKLLTVAGMRQSILKATPFVRAVEEHNRGCPRRDRLEQALVHTGEREDPALHQIYFDVLNMPEPDYHLGVQDGSDAQQTGRGLIALESVLKKEAPDWVVAVGDGNASLSTALCAKKQGGRLVHLEAGLRSNDWTTGAEINRVLVDRIADLFLTPGEEEAQNLRREGIQEERLEVIGNLMIDTLEERREAAEQGTPQEILNRRLMKEQDTQPPQEYGVVTVQRSANIDQVESLHHLVVTLRKLADQYPLLFPLHPHTRERLRAFGLMGFLLEHSRLYMLEPVDYLEMLCLTRHARILVSDSTEMQEDAMVLGIPCLTMRTSTERPITLKENGGTTVLVGSNGALMEEAFAEAVPREARSVRPPLWDGRAGQRAVRAILQHRETPARRTHPAEIALR